MDIEFDAAAAERLILQMDKYCTGVQKETRELRAVLKDPNRWQDNQGQAFRANITEITKELNQALKLESEYIRTFYQRVMELRG